MSGRNGEARALNSRLQWIVAQFTRRLWFRAGLYGAVAVATALVAAQASRFFPDEMANVIGAEAVEGILKILASSMLAVATFSLGTMVAAFSAAASNATPRATKLLVEDPTSQNALATFIGAFIFSLIGIIALSTGYYGPGGRIVLFAVTIVMVVAIIVTFFKWIDYLSNLGRLGVTVDKVEHAASNAMSARCRLPYLGGRPRVEIPADAVPFTGARIGYIQHIDVATLSAIAEAADGTIHVDRLPGQFADTARPLAWTNWQPDDRQSKELLKAFMIDAERSFDQDPRFGVIALAEIASRALSSGVNDPGTAIGVIGRLVRVLALWRATADEEPEVRFPRVHVPGVEVADLFDDAFTPIARDGAGTVEVGIRLQKALASLAQLDAEAFGDDARRHSALALMRANTALPLDADRSVLERLARELGLT